MPLPENDSAARELWNVRNASVIIWKPVIDGITIGVRVLMSFIGGQLTTAHWRRHSANMLVSFDERATCHFRSNDAKHREKQAPDLKSSRPP